MDRELLPTGEVARLLGCSRQHVVNLCKSGVLPCQTVGQHRRVLRRDVVRLARGEDPGGLTRKQRRSLWLHAAVAGKLVKNPGKVVTIAQTSLVRLLDVHPRGVARSRILEWQHLLGGPLERLLEVLTSQTSRSVELRQNSPFAGVLSFDERAAVLDAFIESDR